MGLTIHYRGQLADVNQISKITEELTDITESMGWEWNSLDKDFAEPLTARIVNDTENLSSEIIGHLPLKGISLKPHSNCEPVYFYFDSDGNIRTPVCMILINEGKIKPENNWVSVKTQFAPPEVHITICKLFRYIKNKYIPNLEVHDEGSYWESGNADILKEKLNSIMRAMDILEEALGNIDNHKVSNQEEMILEIEKILRKLD
ncbi:hypothetical protein JYT51_01015 [Candidatus Amoebophilus asiaticus]|nr:hypothetical protein [Candidatus Amoebophilus asiaticus]